MPFCPPESSKSKSPSCSPAPAKAVRLLPAGEAQRPGPSLVPRGKRERQARSSSPEARRTSRRRRRRSRHGSKKRKKRRVRVYRSATPEEEEKNGGLSDAETEVQEETEVEEVQDVSAEHEEPDASKSELEISSTESETQAGGLLNGSSQTKGAPKPSRHVSEKCQAAKQRLAKGTGGPGWPYEGAPDSPNTPCDWEEEEFGGSAASTAVAPSAIRASSSPPGGGAEKKMRLASEELDPDLKRLLFPDQAAPPPGYFPPPPPHWPPMHPPAYWPPPGYGYPPPAMPFHPGASRPPYVSPAPPPPGPTLESFLGRWRDSMGHDVLVEWAKSTGSSGGRTAQLDVALTRGQGGRAIRLNVKQIGPGRFICGHYDLDVKESHRSKLVWVDKRSAGNVSTWERPPAQS